MCEMRKTKTGLYKRAGHYIECEARRDDTYLDLVERVAATVGIQDREDHVCSLSLFRARGQVILAKPLKIDGREVMWTLGSYARMLRKSPESLQIGIAAVPNQSTESYSSDETVHQDEV